MTRLILLRHGESVNNLYRLGTGQSDVALTDLGKKQAEQAASYLATHELIDHIYSSDLIRCVETARPTAEKLGLSIHTDKRLREVDLGDWAGMPIDERKTRTPEAYRLWKEDHAHMQYPNGEYYPDAYDRMVECVTEIAERHPDRTILISTHGGMIRAFEAFAMGYSREETNHVSGSCNASIHIYEWNDGKATLRTRELTDHLR